MKVVKFGDSKCSTGTRVSSPPSAGLTAGSGTPATPGMVTFEVGLVASSLPVSVVAVVVPLVSLHVEPVSITLVLGLLHLHIHAISGETAVRAAGRTSTSEHGALAVVAVAGRGEHSNEPILLPGT